MLGVVEASFAGRPMKVLQSEHTGHCTRPKHRFVSNGRAPAAGPKVAGGQRSRSLANFTTRSIVQVFLGG